MAGKNWSQLNQWRVNLSYQFNGYLRRYNRTALPEEAAEDSYSILPLFTNKKAKSAYEYVVHHSINGKFSIRNRKWKLEFTPGSGGWTAPNDKKAREMGLPQLQLYNMIKDEEETNNVYDQHNRVVRKMTNELKEIVDKGRTTEGESQKNDVPVDIFKVGK